jgi:hypothetical protein
LRCSPTRRCPFPLFFLSLTCGTGLSASPLPIVSHLFFLLAELAPRQCARAAPGRTGWDGRSAWPARTPSDRCARLGQVRLGRGLLPFLPRAAPLWGMACAAEAGATSPILAVDPGATEGIRTALHAAVLQMLGRVRNPSRRATNPIGVFFPFSHVCAGRREEGGCAATTPRRED